MRSPLTVSPTTLYVCLTAVRRPSMSLIIFGIQWEWSLTTERSPAVEKVYNLAKSKLPAVLQAKLSEFPAAIINTHGKDLTVSADPSRSGTPAPATSSSSAASPATAPKPAAKTPAKAVNTATIAVDAGFMASADDLFSILTDEKRIPSWTRAPAQVSLH